MKSFHNPHTRRAFVSRDISQRPARAKRNLDLDVTTRATTVHSGGDAVKVQLHDRPLLIPKNNDRDSSPDEILLIPDVLIRTQNQVVARVFRLLNQVAILKLMPADSTGKADLVSHQDLGDRPWRSIVKQNLQRSAPEVRDRLSLAKCRTAFTSSSVTSKTSVISSGDIPASRFSNTVCTGIRVPRKTQAPLNLPATLSTASHRDQSSPAMADHLSARLRRPAPSLQQQIAVPIGWNHA